MEFAFLQGADDTTNASAYTFAAQNLGTASADRYIIVAAESRGVNTGLVVSSITVGGVSATLAVQATNTAAGGFDVACLAIAAVPTGTTGDVVVTLNVSNLRCSVQLYSVTGISSPTPTATATSTATDPTCTIDVSAGGFAMGCGIDATAGTTAWTGITKDYDSTVEANTQVSSASLVFASAQSSLAITCNLPGTASAPVGVFAAWAPSGGLPQCNIRR